MQLRTGRYGPYYTSTHDCGETKAFARRLGVQCPTDGGEITEKRSRKGRMFYGCDNWPKCEWVSWNRPLSEPCPECGGLQVDLGRGRVRCLKHEGEPVRAPSRNGRQSEDAEAAEGKPTTKKAATARSRVSARSKAAPKKTAARKTSTTKTTTTRARKTAAAAAR